MPWTVYTPTLTPRIAYSWEVLLHHLLKVDFRIETDAEVYRRSAGVCINYSSRRLRADEIFLPAGPLLLEAGLQAQPLDVFQHDGLPAFYAVAAADADLPFDLPALVFYLVTRYEEYLPHQPDKHGRFRAEESLAYQYGFLQQPLVNQWVCRLRACVEARYGIALASSVYRFQPTFDVDMAWAYRYKGWGRNAGALLRSIVKGDWRDAQRRIQVASGRVDDPFFTFSYMEHLHMQYGLQPIFFFLLGNYGVYDKNTSYRQPAMQQLIRRLHQRFPVGIHPSYRAAEADASLREEIRRLKVIIREPVLKSRQHFLRLQFPHTYRALQAASIHADYSMGFAQQIGFRASIATPYPWYDLLAEQATSFMIHPFQVMDVTLKHYLRLSPEEALRAVRLVIEATREVGGVFSTIWHNSSFSSIDGWQSWGVVYESILQMAVSE